ncbi:MAG TPA: hypothetical protein VF593_01700 [Chthoniobacteraceae bacterium]|jgi:hypothetical protein
MILAASEGQLIFVALAAAFAFISWLSGKLNRGSTTPPEASERTAPGQTLRPPPANSEEERMRRFLEALGLPADPTSVPAKPATPPRPRPAHQQRPVPPIIAAPPLPQWPRPKNRPAPEVHQAPPLSFPRPATPEKTPAPVRAGEQIEPEPTPAKSVPAELPQPRIFQPTTTFPGAREEQEKRTGPTLAETLRLALSSPQQLRSAFILAEILGPPPGLRRP